MKLFLKVLALFVFIAALGAVIAAAMTKKPAKQYIVLQRSHNMYY